MDTFTYTLLVSLGLMCVIIRQSECRIPYSPYLGSEDKITRNADDENADTATSQRIREQDIRKLILKKLRFRDLDDMDQPSLDDYLNQMHLSVQKQDKRSQNRNEIVNRVAALLSGLKVRQIESPNVRMPSLRFGRK